MGYSLKQSEFKKSKQGTEFTYFNEEEWNSYPFANEEDTKWFHEAKYGLFLHVGISAIGMVDISWARTTHKLPDPPYWGKYQEYMFNTVRELMRDYGKLARSKF